MPRRPDILSTADIDGFARKLKATTALAEQALALLAAIGSGAPAASRAATSSRTAEKPSPSGKARRRAGKRRPAIPPETVLALLSEKSGVASGDLAKKLGEDRARVSVALVALRDAKKAKMMGEKRLARWFKA